DAYAHARVGPLAGHRLVRDRVGGSQLRGHVVVGALQLFEPSDGVVSPARDFGELASLLFGARREREEARARRVERRRRVGRARSGYEARRYVERVDDRARLVDRLDYRGEGEERAIVVAV